MTRFVLTLEARDDLVPIGEHGIETFGLEQALRFQDELDATFELLADNSAMGFTRPEYASEAVRFFVKGPAVIVYRWNVRPIDVLRVIVGSLDLMK